MNQQIYINTVLQSIATSGGTWSQENAIIVDPNEDEVAGVKYQTIANALTYIATQTPSATNRWVVLVNGTNNESFAVPKWVVIKGIEGVTRLTGVITSAGNWNTSFDFTEAVLEDCIVTNVNIAAGTTLLLANCTIQGATPTGGDMAFIKCSFVTCNLSALTTNALYNCNAVIINTTVSFASGTFSNTYISNTLGTVNLNGGNFDNCLLNLVTVNNGTYRLRNCYVDFSPAPTLTSSLLFAYCVNTTFNNGFTVSTGVHDFSFCRADTVTINGGTVNTRSCNMTISYTAGTWNNNCTLYDNRTSGLTATEVQAAIDELDARLDAHGI
jgi:hypothetical protein